MCAAETLGAENKSRAQKKEKKCLCDINTRERGSVPAL
jgi:hypothetical protein